MPDAVKKPRKATLGRPVYFPGKKGPEHLAKIDWYLEQFGADYSEWMRRIALERIAEHELSTGDRFTYSKEDHQ